LDYVNSFFNPAIGCSFVIIGIFNKFASQNQTTRSSTVHDTRIIHLAPSAGAFSSQSHDHKPEWVQNQEQQNIANITEIIKSTDEKLAVLLRLAMVMVNS